ncbi:MAG TPA: hypothetical protein DCY91_19130 [Cyanobacteria bacterium UBA11370]|nr:hypothetical protein [Cyanobacteria bacterium UBA11370]HBY78282.1 hypothetical protein [Cyanobacteria bacterium UBA11148]
MGRKAKIRKQRKQSALWEASSTSGKPLSQDAARISALVKKSSPELKPELERQGTSWWGRITDALNPFPKVETEKYQGCWDAQDFSEANEVLVGAVAWDGYQQQGKGLVLVQDSDTSPAQIEYVPRRFLKKTMRREGVDPEDIKAIENMLEVYSPEDSVVMVYLSTQGEMFSSLMPMNERTPQECYRLLQETS